MNAVRSMVEIALQSDTQVAREDYLQQISMLLGVRPDAIRSEVAIVEKRKFNPGRETAGPATRPAGESHTKGFEEHLLYVCLHHEHLLQAISSLLAHEWIDVTSTAGRLLDRLLAEVQHNGWNGRESLDQLLECLLASIFQQFLPFVSTFKCAIPRAVPQLGLKTDLPLFSGSTLFALSMPFHKPRPSQYSLLPHSLSVANHGPPSFLDPRLRRASPPCRKLCCKTGYSNFKLSLNIATICLSSIWCAPCPFCPPFF